MHRIFLDETSSKHQASKKLFLNAHCYDLVAQPTLILQYNRPPRKSAIKMMHYRLLPTLAFFAFAFCGSTFGEEAAHPGNSADSLAGSGQPTALQSVTGSKPLANGIEIHSGTAVMQITALRENVLRVRVGPDGHLPEDASWAVLPEARSNTSPVSAEADSTSIGFHTTALRVWVELATMHLRVSDLNGTVVQEDVANRPIEFHGPAFRVYKSMRPEEHYFGLGD